MAACLSADAYLREAQRFGRSVATPASSRCWAIAKLLLVLHVPGHINASDPIIVTKA
jgi:hypothetical protein